VHNDGGLPSPLVFLAAAAARTRRIALVTGIITLPLEDPLRLAEDAAVLDALSGGRLELGFGSGGNDLVFAVFGREVARRHADYDRAFARVREALSGTPLVPDGPPMFPPAPGLIDTMWEAAMSVGSATRAGQHGTGLLLARTAARTSDTLGRSLGEVQQAFVDAYLANFAGQRRPRIGLSRSVYVAPTRAEALADAEDGMRRHAQVIQRRTGAPADRPLEELLARSDVHIGTPDEVITSLRADPLLAVATDLVCQVHPIDPAPEKTLRSLELLAREVAPALRQSLA
jgi:alkanesulfonate monooxygenase SsuD/methylene tetrahydromethanopterin reductase-like flavin-dependent oxidoreductase (luciferase family)